MMSDDANDGQMIFGDLGGLKLPDIPDFDLFPKFKEPMRGRSFSSREELSTDDTRAILFDA